MTFWNKRAGTLLIEKLDSITKAPLAGARFKVLYADGRVVDTEGGKLSSNGIYTTDQSGQIKITGLVGTIVVTEEKAPDGSESTESKPVWKPGYHVAEATVLTRSRQPVSTIFRRKN